MKRGWWVSGKRVISGHWDWNWASETFLIVLDSRDRITGNTRKIIVAGDTPEWDATWKFRRSRPRFRAAREGSKKI